MPEGPFDPHEELLALIRKARARWRWKVALRSLTVVVGAGVATIIAASAGLEQWRFSSTAIVVFRVVTYVTLLAVGWWFFIRPVTRHVTDEQVALYLEEHEPSLQALLLSAVDVSRQDPASRPRDSSNALLERLVLDAIERCRSTQAGVGVERRSVRRSTRLLAGVAAVTILIFWAGPAYLRQGAVALLVPVRSLEAAKPYRLDVRPGHARIARGADVSIIASPVGFTPDSGELYISARPGAAFERQTMTSAATRGSKDPRFRATVYNLREPAEYYVRAAGVQSAVFRLDVTDIPRVERLQLEYVFPAYTGLPPQQVEAGGDIAVLRGTTVRARVHPTMNAAAGRIVLDGGEPARLVARADGVLEGEFQVTRDGSYQVELEGPDKRPSVASSQYTIEALDDHAPTVAIAKPQRDLRPTSIEEVFSEARAEDDYGVRQLDLVMSVNGGPEKPVRLAAPAGKSRTEVTSAYTFFLEEMSLQPGDVVAYYARATDNDTVQGPKTTVSDMYFLQIRPFRKDYRAAESQASGQAGQGGGANDPSAFSDEQRRIVSGTFNVARDRQAIGAQKFRENTTFLGLAQGQLRERVEGLAGRIAQRVGSGTEGMQKVAEALAEAAKAMRGAEPKLQALDPKGALPPEQQALRSLQQAEEVYREVRIAMSQERGGGGGGGGSSPQARDLADLFGLEADKLRNQYESFQQGQQQAADRKLDEVLERLKDLAKRQEQEAERQRQLASNRQSGSGDGSRQRDLADQAEETARRLERLSREQNRSDLAEAARQAQQAADAMRRAAASRDAGSVASARDAADRLGEARDRLERRRAGSQRDARDSAMARARSLTQGMESMERRLRESSSGERGASGTRGDPKSGSGQREGEAGKETTGGSRAQSSSQGQGRGDQRSSERGQGDVAKGQDQQGRGQNQRPGQGQQQGQQGQGQQQGQQAQGQRQGQGQGQRQGQGQGQEQGSGQGQDQRSAQAQGQGRGQAQGDGSQGQRGSSNARTPTTGGGSQIATGPPTGSAGDGSARPGPVDAESARQLRREARERAGEARELRGDLRGLGVDTRELDRLIGSLNALDGDRLYDDREAVARLQAQMVDGFRQLEFDLRRKLDKGGDVLVSGNGDVPREYRSRIEEYYRALAREKKR